MGAAIASSGNQLTVRNVTFTGIGTAIDGPGDNGLVVGCHQESGQVFIDGATGHSNVRVSACDGGSIDASNGDSWVVSNFLTYGQVAAGTATELTFSNVTTVSPNGPRDHLYTFDSVDGLVMSGCNSRDTGGYDAVYGTALTEAVIRGNVFGDPTSGAKFEASQYVTFDNNLIGSNGYLGEHGVELVDSSDCRITNNQIIQGGQDSNNTYDGVNLSGDSNRNFIAFNSISSGTASPQFRYAVNVGTATCDDNIIVGNDWGGTANYATAALNDAGTSTVLTFPGHGTHGDNFGR